MIHSDISRYVQIVISDEWLAHYQYWIGHVIMGNEYEDVKIQFLEHSMDEYEHATKLASWLRQFPREAHLPYTMGELTNRGCGYIFPSGNVPEALIPDAIKGEQCAIAAYDDFFHQLTNEEYILQDIIFEILLKEKEHLADLRKLEKLYPQY